MAVHFRIAVALMTLSCLWQAWSETVALGVSIPAGDSRLMYTGRFDWRDPRGPRCAWSGTRVSLTLDGTALDVRCRCSGPEDYLAAIVDGRDVAVLSLKPQQERYPLVRGLARGRHVVELVKRTEPLVGTVQYFGFDMNAGARLLPPPPRPARRLEIIGDSISAGFGDESHDKNDPFEARTENNLVAYGAVAARQVRAEYACIAWSGRKMAPDDTVPEVYDRTLPADPSSRWDFASWIPHAVVVNLGTNDFRTGPPDRAGWIEAYVAFVHHLRERFPQAHVFCAVGSMLSDRWPEGQRNLSTARAYIEEVIETLRDPRVHFLEFPEQREQDGYGASWHPSRHTHEIMARVLVDALRRELSW